MGVSRGIFQNHISVILLALPQLAEPIERDLKGGGNKQSCWAVSRNTALQYPLLSSDYILVLIIFRGYIYHEGYFTEIKWSNVTLFP